MWVPGCSSTHGMHKEYGDLTTAGAVTQRHQAMGTRHHAWAQSIQIMKVEETAGSKCHHLAVKQFHDWEMEFLLPLSRLTSQQKPHFPTMRPNVFFQMWSLLVIKYAQIPSMGKLKKKKIYPKVQAVHVCVYRCIYINIILLY